MIVDVTTIPWGTQVGIGIGALMGLHARGIGYLGDCPSYAPYATEGGGCSNVPPEVDAFDYFRSGGVLDETSQTIVGWDDPYQLDCPSGSAINPFTGRMECVSAIEAKYTTPSGYVIRASSDRSAMDAIAAEAQAQGRARGFNITCQSIPIGGDPITGEQRYAGTCSVAGKADQSDPSLLLTGSGWETLATELGVSPFFQQSAGYQYIPPTSQQTPYLSQTQASAVTGKPNQSVPPTTTLTPMRTNISNTANVLAGNAPSMEQNTFADRVGAEQSTDTGSFFSDNSTLLLIAAGVGIYMLMNKGGR